MPANRYFTHQDLIPHIQISLEPDEALHLKTVMRNIEGDEVELVNGRGFFATAHVSKIHKKGADLSLFQVTHTTKPKPLQLGIGTLVQERLDWILEKGCELGMTHIDLIHTDFSGKNHFTPGQLERMERVLIAALKQSGRLWLPTIGHVPSLEAYLNTSCGNIAHTIYYGAIDESAPSLLKTFDPASPFKLLVGPAKGFSPLELAALKSHVGVYLNDAVLRAETAALAMITLAKSIM